MSKARLARCCRVGRMFQSHKFRLSVVTTTMLSLVAAVLLSLPMLRRDSLGAPFVVADERLGLRFDGELDKGFVIGIVKDGNPSVGGWMAFRQRTQGVEQPVNLREAEAKRCAGTTRKASSRG